MKLLNVTISKKASNNNSAILNVQEKLKKYNLDFLVAVLGSKKNKENFVLAYFLPLQIYILMHQVCY